MLGHNHVAFQVPKGILHSLGLSETLGLLEPVGHSRRVLMKRLQSALLPSTQQQDLYFPVVVEGQRKAKNVVSRGHLLIFLQK